MLPVIMLTPLVWRPVEAYYNRAGVAGAAQPGRPDRQSDQAG